MTTLTLKQQEKSLLKSKGKPVKKSTKVVLCNPYEKYWPLAGEDDAEQIKNLLKTLLIFGKRKKNLPWKKLLKLPKVARKELIKEQIHKTPVSAELLKQRKSLVFGLNAVSRAVQHQNISCCILAADAKPLMMVEHITTLAVSRNIPVIILPTFREFMCATVGFPCTALGTKVTIEYESQYKLLQNLVANVCEKFPVPISISNSGHPERVETAEKLTTVQPATVQKSVPTHGVYLQRKADGKKAFQPPVLDSSTLKIPVDPSTDFISLTMEKSTSEQAFSKFRYIPSNLKRTQNNPKRKLNKK